MNPLARIVLIVAVIAAGFAATIVLRDRTTLDETQLAAWRPPEAIAALGRLSAPFARHADFGRADVAVPPGPPVRLEAVPGERDVEVAALRVTAGAVRLSHPCNGDACPQTLCLCASGTPTTDAFRGCLAGAAADAPPPPVVCAAGSDRGQFALDRNARVIAVETLGETPARVALR